MKLALDPTPFHHDYELLEFPRLVAELGYEYLQLTPHRDFIPFFNHPRADDELLARFRKACDDAGVGIVSVLPVLRWSGPDEDAREAAVRNWKRVIQSMGEIIRRAGTLLRLVHVADTTDHHRSHGLRYITNPPGNSVRVHQHLKIGDGDVDWDDFFSALADIDFFDRPDTVMVSSVFAEDQTALEVSRYQLATMTDYVTKHTK